MTQLPLLLFEFDSAIRRQYHNEDFFYSLVDIVAYFVGEKYSNRYWSDTKRRMIAEESPDIRKIVQLKFEALDGKFYATDCGDKHTCLRVILSIPQVRDKEKKQRLEAIKQWLVGLGADDLNSRASAKREKELIKLERYGYGEHPQVVWLKTRHDNIAAFTSLKKSINLICDNPNWGQLINHEYQSFFGLFAGDLKAILNTQKIRDSLPAFQLQLLTAAEIKLNEEIARRGGSLDNDEIVFIIERVVTPLGVALKSISDSFGLDHVTGQPLLKD